MRSNWYNKELQKAILGYREAIAALEDVKEDVRYCDKDDIWSDQTDARIHHLRIVGKFFDSVRSENALYVAQPEWFVEHADEAKIGLFGEGFRH